MHRGNIPQNWRTIHFSIKFAPPKMDPMIPDIRNHCLKAMFCPKLTQPSCDVPGNFCWVFGFRLLLLLSLEITWKYPEENKTTRSLLKSPIIFEIYRLQSRTSNSDGRENQQHRNSTTRPMEKKNTHKTVQNLQYIYIHRVLLMVQNSGVHPGKLTWWDRVHLQTVVFPLSC